MKKSYNIPEEKISIGVIDIDAKGENGGTHYWVTHTFHMKITDSKESFIKKASESFNEIKSNLVNSR